MGNMPAANLLEQTSARSSNDYAQKCCMNFVLFVHFFAGYLWVAQRDVYAINLDPFGWEALTICKQLLRAPSCSVSFANGKKFSSFIYFRFLIIIFAASVVFFPLSTLCFNCCIFLVAHFNEFVANMWVYKYKFVSHASRFSRDSFVADIAFPHSQLCFFFVRFRFVFG